MKPINFNSEMIRALIDGRKTQTRRIVKPQSIIQKKNEFGRHPLWLKMQTPYGQPGDRLLVKNTDITLEITNVRVERVQDISEEDVLAEGVVCDVPHTVSRDHFIDLWNSIYGQGAWERNDWVWVYEFKKL